MVTLTVFTPTYNRINTLVRTYESLCNQTSKDFEWLIIDDGSTDDTNAVVSQWIKDAIIPIRYIYKENGGLFTGYNTAVNNIYTELNVCIDSDDYMPENAVELIVNNWNKQKQNHIAGLIGLDYYINGGPIGGTFKTECEIYFHEQKYKLNHTGDTKIVCRTDLMKEIYPMPSLGEKNFNPVWYYLKIGEKYKFYTVNKNFCIVDYQKDGMAAGIYNQYKNSPRSFAELRKVYMTSKHLPLKRKYIDAAHYVSSSIFSKDWNFINNSPKPILTVLAIPFGILIHTFILYKLKNK